MKRFIAATFAALIGGTPELALTVGPQSNI